MPRLRLGDGSTDQRSLNILKTAWASNEALARAVRFQPGALRHDVVSPLYDLLSLPVVVGEEPSGVELA